MKKEQEKPLKEQEVETPVQSRDGGCTTPDPGIGNLGDGDDPTVPPIGPGNPGTPPPPPPKKD